MSTRVRGKPAWELALAQNSDVILKPPSYTRVDFTALRAWVQRIPLERIASLYYSEESPQVSQGLEKFLTRMRHDLIERAIVLNPFLAEGLAKARNGGDITAKILDTLVKAADIKPSRPTPSDLIAQWFRPGTAKILLSENLRTLSDLRHLIEQRGPTWWRPVPRIGEQRARAIERWLNRDPQTAVDPRTQIQLSPDEDAVSLKTSLSTTPLPLERIAALPSSLDGQTGRNRASDFCFIRARNDLEAIHAYLAKFRHQPHTFRAYQRELERLVLWCVLIRKCALSSMLVDDCEAYKDFLGDPDPILVGPRQGRFTPRWKPFAGQLSPSSQKQAVQIIRTTFAWLVNVRYLGGNPWVAVRDPSTEQALLPMQIERALPSSLWEKTVAYLDDLCTVPFAAQMRAARAAILLMGESGLRRSEAANAWVSKLRPTDSPELWRLDVLGKRNKWRMVPVSQRTYLALQAHWADLENFLSSERAALPFAQDNEHSKLALIRPLRIPQTPTATERHKDCVNGYSSGGLATLVVSTLKKIADSGPFTPTEAAKLRNTSAHAFRHTFGTTTIAQGLPHDVLQKILGHVSLATTSIYVQAEQQRILDESAKVFASR